MVYIKIGEGDYIGDIDYVDERSEGRRVFSVKALKNTEAYCLNKKDLHELENSQKEIILNFFEDSKARLKAAKKIKSKAEDHMLKIYNA